MNILWITDKADLTGGGAAKLLPSATKVLEDYGHMVVPFLGSLGHGGVPSKWLPYQPPPVPVRSAPAIARRALPDVQVTVRLERLIEEVRPDVAVVQNVHQYLSLDVFRSLAKSSIPTVYLVNDHALYCVNKYGYRDRRPCHECVDKKFYRGVLKGCSLKPGIIGCFEAGIRALALHYYWARDFLANVGAIYTNGSELVRILVALGVDPERIIQGVYPLNIDMLPDQPQSESVNGRYIVFYGVSLPVKGLDTILNAFAYITDPVLLKVYLLQPSPSLQSRIANINMKGPHRIELDLSSRWDTGVREAVQGARAVIIPSSWHSPHELVLYESMALGKAVILSSDTGNAELVTDGVDALVFRMNDPEDLARKMVFLWRDKSFAEQIGKAAQRTYREVIKIEHWYQPFMRAVTLARKVKASVALDKAGGFQDVKLRSNS